MRRLRPRANGALIDAERARRETVHRTPDRPAPLAPEPEVQALLERVSAREGRALVDQAVLSDAEHHGGSVSANRVRDLLRPGGVWRSGLSPQLVSARYSSLKSEGLLRVVGDERISGAYTGNNTGKTVYARELTARGFRVLRRARDAGAPTPWLDVTAPVADPAPAPHNDVDTDDLFGDLL